MWNCHVAQHFRLAEGELSYFLKVAIRYIQKLSDPYYRKMNL